jgi:hypothetical protein
MDIWAFCKCSPEGICPFCKILSVACLTVLGVVLGFLIGRRSKNKKDVPKL